MSTPFDVSSSTAVPTETPAPASQQQQQSPVNAAQSNTPHSFATQQQQQQPQSQSQDVAAMRAHYEARISALMSEKDRALNERDKAISAHAALLHEHEQYKAMNSTSLQAAVDAAQNSTNAGKALQQQVNELQGQVIRYKVLLEKPHLAAYQSFIPATGTEEEIVKAVQTLEEIRQKDMQQSGYPVGGTFVGNNALVAPGQQGQQQHGQGTPPATANVGALYQGRSNLPQSLQQGMPGSSPSMMNPNANVDPTTRIQQLFAEAQKSPDPDAFQKAVEQAKVLADASINQSMGRTL